MLRDIWAGAALEAVASPDVELPVSTDLLPSSFQVGLAAQASIAAAVSAAGAIYRQRSGANQR
ncbi:MAG: CoA transferase, partial [Pseudomonadales bacterium]